MGEAVKIILSILGNILCKKIMSTCTFGVMYLYYYTIIYSMYHQIKNAPHLHDRNSKVNYKGKIDE